MNPPLRVKGVTETRSRDTLTHNTSLSVSMQIEYDSLDRIAKNVAKQATQLVRTTARQKKLACEQGWKTFDSSLWDSWCQTQVKKLLLWDVSVSSAQRACDFLDEFKKASCPTWGNVHRALLNRWKNSGVDISACPRPQIILSTSEVAKFGRGKKSTNHSDFSKIILAPRKR